MKNCITCSQPFRTYIPGIDTVMPDGSSFFYSVPQDECPVGDFLSDVHFSDFVTLRNVRSTYCACAIVGQYGAVVWCEWLSANGASNPLLLLCLQFPSVYDSFLVLSLSLPLLSSLFVLCGSSDLTPQSSG